MAFSPIIGRDPWAAVPDASIVSQMFPVPDGLASDVTGFAATHDLPEDRAYELLVSVGLATLGGHEVEVTVDGERFVLECPTCGGTFDAPDEFADHDHDQ
jgi:hypothetical protein